MIDPDNIQVQESNLPELIKITQIPVFDFQIYNLEYDKEYEHYIKDIEIQIRRSFEYRQFIKYLRENMNMNKCSFLKGVSNEESFDIKIEIHHYPFTLRDIVEIVYRKRNYYNESLDAIQYFSNADINAKGYQIQTFLELDKSGNTGILGTYVAEQKMYGSQINVTLQPRSIENCYDLIPVYDYDAEYTAYISENMIYLYPIDITDEALNQEIKNNCPNSVNQLSSDIKPIEMW